MADAQIGHQAGFAAASIGGTNNRSNLNGSVGTDIRASVDNDNLDNIAAMRTRLTAISGSYYTAARLNQMTYNDMVYAIRVADNPTTIKQ